MKIKRTMPLFLLTLMVLSLIAGRVDAAHAELFKLANRYQSSEPFRQKIIESEILQLNKNLEKLNILAEKEVTPNPTVLEAKADIFTEIGFYYSGLDLHKIALELFRNAYLLSPQNSQRAVDFAVELIDDKNYEEANEILLDVIKTSPAHAELAAKTLARSYYMSGQYSNCRKVCLDTLKKYSKTKHSPYLALMYVLSQGFESKKFDLDESLQKTVDFEEWPGPILTVLISPKAKEIPSRYFNTNSEYEMKSALTEALYYIGDSYLALDRPEEAFKYFKACISLNFPLYVEYSSSKLRLEQYSKQKSI